MKRACRARATPASDAPKPAWPRKLSWSFAEEILSANGARKKMRIQLPNTLYLWRDFNLLKTATSECTAPLLRSEETRIGTNLRVEIDIGKALQNLEH